MVRLIMRVQMALALIAVFIAPVFGAEVYFNDFNAAPGTKYPEWTSTGYSNSANRAGTVAAGSGPQPVASVLSPTARNASLANSEGPPFSLGRPSIRNISCV